MKISSLMLNDRDPIVDGMKACLTISRSPLCVSRRIREGWKCEDLTNYAGSITRAGTGKYTGSRNLVPHQNNFGMPVNSILRQHPAQLRPR